jgi:hypothetical protein
LGYASLEDRVLLVAAFWRTNLTMRQLAPLYGVSKPDADRVIDDLGPKLALQPRRRFAKNAVLIVDGTLVPTLDHKVADQPKNSRYSTNHQVVIDADTRRSISCPLGHADPAAAGHCCGMIARHVRNEVRCAVRTWSGSGTGRCGSVPGAACGRRESLGHVRRHAT